MHSSVTPLPRQHESGSGPEIMAADHIVPVPRRKARVHWSDAEKLTIARESLRLLEGFADMSQLEAIRKAMASCLPVHRQRDIAAMSEVRWIRPLWQQAEAVQRAADRELATAAQTGQTPSGPAASPGLHESSFEALLDALATKIGLQLADAVGQQIQETVMRQVIDTLQGLPLQAGALPEGATRVHTPPRERRPRVTVVGLLNQQAEDVKHAFAQAIDFTFIKSQQVGGSGGHGGAGLLARGAQADVVIQMIDFTGHDVDAASKHLDVPFVRVNGSVSALKRWLSRWLNGEIALARA